MAASRRQFLNQVGGGMLMAGLGTSLAADLGIGVAFANDIPGALDFGGLEPLVRLMQETPPAELTGWNYLAHALIQPSAWVSCGVLLRRSFCTVPRRIFSLICTLCFPLAHF